MPVHHLSLSASLSLSLSQYGNVFAVCISQPLLNNDRVAMRVLDAGLGIQVVQMQFPATVH
jgi:hypothetical protein